MPPPAMQRELSNSVLNKHTGEPASIIAGSSSVIDERVNRWENIVVDVRDCPPYENPELLLQSHVIATKSDSTITAAEWQESGWWHRHDFRREELLIFPAGELGKWRAATAHSALIAYLNPQLLVDAAADIGWTRETLCLERQIGITDELLHGCLIALERESIAGYPNDPLYGDTIAYTIGAHLLSRYSEHPSAQPARSTGLSANALKVVTEFIAENYARPMRISELAKLTHLSPYHFSRLFKQSTGVSPYRYLMNHRVRRAIGLLATQQFTYKEVAYIVGFYDVSHFVRVFKKITGLSPSDVRLPSR